MNCSFMKHMENAHVEINLEKTCKSTGNANSESYSKQSYKHSSLISKRYKKDGMTRRPFCACQRQVNKSKKHITQFQSCLISGNSSHVMTRDSSAINFTGDYA